jgi:hypothetical protein
MNHHWDWSWIRYSAPLVHRIRCASTPGSFKKLLDLLRSHRFFPRAAADYTDGRVRIRQGGRKFQTKDPDGNPDANPRHGSSFTSLSEGNADRTALRRAPHESELRCGPCIS